MKKRFLDRFTYPYLQKRLPENIVPGRGLSAKRVKSLHKGKPLRSPMAGLSPDRGKTSNRSPGLCLRLMKGALRLHKRKLFGEKHAWSGILKCAFLVISSLAERFPDTISSHRVYRCIEVAPTAVISHFWKLASLHVSAPKCHPPGISDSLLQ